MQSQDVSNSWNQANSKVSSLNTYNADSKAEKKLKRQAANSSSQSKNISEQLNSVRDKQKRFQKNVPTSADQMLKLFDNISGSGGESVKYIRKKLLETSVKIGPQLKEIVTQAAIKSLGCTQEQTYQGISVSQLNINPLPQLDPIVGIYIPVKQFDLFGNLKNSPDSLLGKIYYEKPQPEVKPEFRPFSYLCNEITPTPEDCGKEPFPFNKELNLRMNADNVGQSFKTKYGEYYKGTSGQNLFDFQYTKTNAQGVTGDYMRIVLIDRNGRENVGTTGTAFSGLPANNVIEFLKDYYSTIKFVDSSDVLPQIVNFLSKAVTIKAELGANEIDQQTKFGLILQRILGLCFDNRSEIDVSGIAKVAELDGVDDTFFEFNEVDLRFIDNQISNIQQGVMEFEDCNNVKVPVNSDSLTQQLVDFRNNASGMTLDEQVKEMEKVIDSISQNPDWNIFLPTNFNASISLNKDLIKNLALCIAGAVLSPKILLPIFALLAVLESTAINTYNQAVTSGNTNTASGTTQINQNILVVNNIINDAVDFIKKFKTFVIDVVSRIGAIFLKELFELLKRDIINLLSVIIKDFKRSKKLSYYTIILQIIQITLVVAQLIDDYRKCKSLIDNILQLLNLINNLGKRQKIPLWAQKVASQFRPGTSAEGMQINTLQFLQELGVPTGTLPDGSPNFMNFLSKSIHKGNKKNHDEAGVSDASVTTPFGVFPVDSIPR
jgi:hypothetical protein